jgi:hypothetical protein
MLTTCTRRTLRAAFISAAVLSAATACAGTPTHTTVSPSAKATASAGDGVGDMAGMPMGDGMSDAENIASGGLDATQNGLTLSTTAATLPAGTPAKLQYRILNLDSAPVTKYQDDQTKLMHFYLIRSDLTGFQHVHPTMATGGTWTAPLAGAQPGRYRVFASFIAAGPDGKPHTTVVSKPITVPGKAATVPLPAPATSATADGYTVTLNGELMAGMAHDFGVVISKNGKPVTDLQPYLATYAHLTAFRDGNLAFAHLHPEGPAAHGNGGPKLRFHALLPAAGNYRLFLQFQTAGTLHTAAVTVRVR